MILAHYTAANIGGQWVSLGQLQCGSGAIILNYFPHVRSRSSPTFWIHEDMSNEVRSLFSIFPLPYKKCIYVVVLIHDMEICLFDKLQTNKMMWLCRNIAFVSLINLFHIIQCADYPLCHSSLHQFLHFMAYINSFVDMHFL